MKFLIHSNGPEATTGYGIQTAHLARCLKAAGHDVAISAFYGQQCGIGEWEGMPVYPVGYEPYGNDILVAHALDWFDHDPTSGWIITLLDVFGIQNPALAQFQILAWCPVDHFPVPPPVLDFFARYPNAVPLAMTRYGETQLRAAGLDPLYAPLAVDTDVYCYTPTVPVPDGHVPHWKDHLGVDTGLSIRDVPGREVIGCEPDDFVVAFVGMNKQLGIWRKGQPFALMAFAEFARKHPEAKLYMHTEVHGGAGGSSMIDLAMKCGVAEHQIVFPDQYRYMLNGYTAEHMAAIYSAADVLLAPSMGEGFGVPAIEAQACGVPVIVTNFAAQPELVGYGWKVEGQPYYEAPQASHMICPDLGHISQALDEAWELKHNPEQRETAATMCREKALQYDVQIVFDTYWTEVIKALAGPEPITLAGGRPPMAEAPDEIAVLIPALNRPGNVRPLVDSFAAADDGTANLYFVCDEEDVEQIKAVVDAGAGVIISDRGSSYAQKVNSAYEQTDEPWLFVCGDDVKFHDGWIAAARPLSDRYDVIGTNDSPEGTGNPRVASGAHADHFFIRRAYLDEHGGALNGRVFHEGYRHFFTDVELVELAKARGVFTPCLDSMVEHMHPDLGKADVDDTYLAGWGEKEHDAAEWRKRAPLVQMQRPSR